MRWLVMRVLGMGDSVAVRMKVLGNGLCVCAQQANLHTVGIAFGVRYGSIDELPDVNGSAHFLEHMMFKGTRKRTWKDIKEGFRSLGAYNNAFTDHETTVYTVSVYSGYLEKAIGILSDMIINSTLPEKEFELERGPIINENLMRDDNPMFMTYDYMNRALYRRHPAGMSISGNNETTIPNIKRETLLQAYTRYYNPGNSVLSIYGGASVEKAMSLASEYFGDFEKAHNKPKRKIAREKQEKRIVTIKRKGIKQTRIGIGFKCREFAKSLREPAGFRVIERYLYDRMFEEIRDKRGLSYDPRVSYELYSTFGFIAASAGIEEKRSEEAKRVMLKVFEDFQNGEIDREGLERTKKALYIENITAKDYPASMSIEIANSELLFGDKDFLDRLAGEMRKVSLDDVRELGSRYIDIDRYSMVLLKPA